MSNERIKILYMDDRPQEVDGIVQMLKTDFFVTQVDNPNQAREILRNDPYDIIILDYDFLGSDKADTILAKIREENYHIKVIMVTAILRNIHQLARVLNQGISKCYFKDDPMLFEHLREGIHEVVQNRNLIIHGLESWLDSREKDDEQPLLVSGDKSYTAKQLLDEIKKNSDIGKAEINSLVLLAIKLLSEDKS